MKNKKTWLLVSSTVVGVIPSLVALSSITEDSQKNDANNELKKLEHLNNKQKNFFAEKIELAITEAEVQSVIATAKMLDAKMEALNSAVQNGNAIKQTQNYKAAEDDYKQDFDTVLSNATNAYDKTNGQNIDAKGIEDLIKKLKVANNNLDGDEFIAEEKERIQPIISYSKNLTEAQKSNLKNELEEAQTLNQVEEIEKLNSRLDELMLSIKNLVEKFNSNVETLNYKEANKEAQKQFDEVLAESKSMLQSTNIINFDNLDSYYRNLLDANAQLDGESRVRFKKISLKSTINKGPLNNSQRNFFLDILEPTNTIAELDKLDSQVEKLSEAMNQLDTDEKNFSPVRSENKYKFAIKDLKEAFDEADTNATNVLNINSEANLDVNAVKELNKKLKEAYEALDGGRRQENANNELDTLTHLNKAQRKAIKQAIQDATSDQEITAAINDAKTLNDKMDDLNKAITTANEVKSTPKYTEATNKDIFNNALTNAESAKDNDLGTNVNASQVNSLINLLNEAKDNLDGNNELQNSKQDTDAKINDANNLTENQKNNLKELLKNANTVADVNNVEQQINPLNEAMQSLKEAISKANEVATTQDYLDADFDKQETFNNSKTNSENTIVLGTNQNPKEIEALINELNTSTEQLNGAEKLNTEKNNLDNAIVRAEYLNNAQKTALQNEIKTASNLEDLTQVETKIKPLDDAMKLLSEKSDDLSSQKSTIEYQNATSTPKESFDNALTNAESAINYENGKNFDIAQVIELTNQLEQKYHALDGKEKIDNADNEKDLVEPQKGESTVESVAQETQSNPETKEDETKSDEDQKAKTEDSTSEEKQIDPEKAQNNAQPKDSTQPKETNSNIVSNIDKNHIEENQSIQKAIQKVNDLLYLSDVDKSKIISEIQNNINKDKATYNKIVNDAISLDKEIEDIVKTLNDLMNGYLQDKSKSAQSAIDKIKDKSSQVGTLQHTLILITNKPKIQASLYDLTYSNITDPKLQNVIDYLQNTISKNVFGANIYSLNNVIFKTSQKQKQQFDGIQEMLDGLKENNWDKVNLGNYKLNKIEIKNNDLFVTALKLQDAFNIFKKNVKDITLEDIYKVKNVNFEKADNVLRTAYQEKLDQLLSEYTKLYGTEKLRWPWWAALSAIIVGIGTTIFGLIKTNRREK
ncbi:hypothetical protein [Mycoplasma hafezii]|uniref:hypothetical protein n=1 Tax=Mycoplasma hafezii TaxID=525886 RepID=UPI003CF3E692